MNGLLSTVSGYLSAFWKSGPSVTNQNATSQAEISQLFEARLNQTISDRLPGCSLCRATLRETKEGKLSLHLGIGELFHFSNEETMHRWLGDEKVADVLEIQDQRKGYSRTFFLLQRTGEWGYDTFESKAKLFDQLREDYGVLWKLRDLENNLTSYVHFKTGIFGSQYVDVDYQNLAILANTLKLEGLSPPTSTRQSDSSSWGKGIAACVLGGLLASAGKSLIERDNPVSDAIATLGPPAFKATFAYQMAALNGLDTLPGALLTGMMFLPESVIGQTLCPQLVGNHMTPYQHIALEVPISSNYAYLAIGSGFQIVDVSNVTNPMLAGSYDTTGNAYGVALFDNYAYVADYASGLQIIDVSSVTTPTPAGSCDTPGFAFGVAVSGNYAYVADGDSGLQIIDVSNIANPILAGFYDTPGRAMSIAVSGNYAYVANEYGGLQIIDVSNVANPVLASSYDTPGLVVGVALSGNHAFVADYQFGLQIIDVSNVTSPTLVGSYDTPDYARDVAVSGSYAYVADWTSGLQILDVSNVANPTFAGSYDTPGNAVSVDISGNYAYVADWNFGLQIINWNIPGPCPTSSSSTTSSTSSSTTTSSSFSTTSDTSSTFSPTSFSTINSLSTTFFSLESSTSTSTTSSDFPFLWVGLIGGGLFCLCLVGGTTYILRRKLTSSNHANRLPEHGRTSRYSFELDPTVLRSRKVIGDVYYQLGTIVKKEAEEIYENTGHVIAFPEGKKKLRYIIGKGNFGALKVAQRIEDGEYVASKKVKGQENMIASEEEAHMQQDASGDNVLPIYNTIRLEEALYHFMPLAGYGNGSDIQHYLSALNNPKLAVEIIKFVAKDVLTGLKTMHDKEIYHLDIKPDNVVFTNDGKGYITDFGCAKKVEGKEIVVIVGKKTFEEYVPNTQISYKSIGDTRYFSPERLQACKEKTTFDAEKADTWAAGMMLLQMAKNLSPLELFQMPGNFGARAQLGTKEYFQEKLNRFEELQKPEEREIWWVIRGLLDPEVEKRFTAERALQTPCFKGLNKKTQAHVFEDLRAEKLIQTAGIGRAELNLKDYQHISQIVEKSGEGVYNSQEHHRYYKTPEKDYQLTPADVDPYN